MNFKGQVFLEALTSKSLINGVQITIALTVVAFALGLVIGLAVAVIRDSRLQLLRGVAWTYIWIFRGIPTTWLHGSAIVLVALYAALFGLGTAAYRTLYANNR